MNIRTPNSLEIMKARSGKPWRCHYCANSIKLRVPTSPTICTCHKSEQRRLQVVEWIKHKEGVNACAE